MHTGLLAAGFLFVTTLGACNRDSKPEGAAAPTSPPINPSESGRSGDAGPPPTGKQCIVHLHGKSGRGGPASESGGITHLRPDGNAEGWGGLQWMYFPDSGYEQVRSIVARAITEAGCGRVLVHGFSNGGAAAGKLYCRGERFGGTVVGVIADDPVPDHAVERCAPASGVKIRVYWTGGLANATDGWKCSEGDWTCEGGTTIGIAKYVEWLRTTAAPSIHKSHQEYAAPPEYSAWW